MPDQAEILVEQAAAEIGRLTDKVANTCDPKLIFSLGTTTQKYLQQGEDMGLQIWDPEMKRLMELFSSAALTAGDCKSK